MFLNLQNATPYQSLRDFLLEDLKLQCNVLLQVNHQIEGRLVQQVLMRAPSMAWLQHTVDLGGLDAKEIGIQDKLEFDVETQA